MSLYEDSTKEKNESNKFNFSSAYFSKIIALIGVTSIFVNLYVNYLSKPYMQTLDLDFPYVVDLIVAAISLLLYVYMIIVGKTWASLVISILHIANFLMFFVDLEIKFYTLIYLPFPMYSLSLLYASIIFSAILFCLPFLFSKIKVN